MASLLESINGLTTFGGLIGMVASSMSSKDTSKGQVPTDNFYVDSNSKNKKFDKKMHLMLNINLRKTSDPLWYIDRLYSVFPEYELTTLHQYVFFTRPDLNILRGSGENVTISKTASHDPFFNYLWKTDPVLYKSLTSKLTEVNDFIPYLTGRTTSIQLPDQNIKTYSINQPYTNYLLPYAGNNYESTTGGTFDVTFREDNKNRIINLFQCWNLYMHYLSRNMCVPKRTYINQNKCDYASSVYVITCTADNNTIVHWSKYTGVFPINVPWSDLSFNQGGDTARTRTIQFQYFHVEHMNPYILHDLNKNAHVASMKNNKRNFIPFYDNKFMSVGYGPSGSPWVYRDKKTDPFQLRWKDNKLV